MIDSKVCDALYLYRFMVRDGAEPADAVVAVCEKLTDTWYQYVDLYKKVVELI